MATGGDAYPRPTVTLTTRPLWRIRLARELPRYMLCALSLAGLAASARFAIAPPHTSTPSAPQRGAAPPDLAAEGFATLFARRYLTWNAADPQAHQQALAGLVGQGMEPDAGLQIPSAGTQQVLWAEVVQAREQASGTHVYTVAAQTDSAGLQYLTVSVARKPDGSLALGDYPAFVGAPATSAAQTAASGGLREVSDPALATVVERALRNYLAGSESELAADLTSSARVSLPRFALTLEAVQRLQWAARGAVLAAVQARDARGTRYALAYELDVNEEAGRWEVSAVQMNPTS
jgi:Conjugative transposon protein TcpC